MISLGGPLRLYYQIVKVPLLVTGGAVIALHFTFEFVIGTQPCLGGSMLPTINHDGDMVLTLPLAYWRPRWLGGGDQLRPQRGDVVVATNPTNPSYTICKRVLGVENDIVEVDPRDGTKWWSARYATENRIKLEARKGHYVRVPRGHLWLSGDNLSNSSDSRDYGPIPIALVKSKAIAKIWSNGWPTWKRLDEPAFRYLGESPQPPPPEKTPIVVLDSAL